MHGHPRPILAILIGLTAVSAALRGVAPAQAPVWISGATVQLFDIQEPIDQVYQLVPNQTPNLNEARSTINFGNNSFTDPVSSTAFSTQFLVKVFGQIEAPITGTYEFALESDDGSLLYLDDSLLIDNDGTHGPETVTALTELPVGWHSFQIDAFNDVGDFLLQLRWRKPGDLAFSVIPSSHLRTDNNVVRVTAPGKKFLLKSGTDRRPGTGLPLEGMHPAWEIETIRPGDFTPQVGAMTLAGSSTLFLATFTPNQTDALTWEPESQIWRVDNIDGLPANVTATQVAGFGLPDSARPNETTGLAWVDGELFIAERTGVFRMIDNDEDGVFEEKVLIGDSWSWDNFHQFAFCLKHRSEPDGEYLYGALSVAIALGGNSDSNRADYNGSVYKLKIPEPGAGPNPVQYLSGGFRTPNGVGFGPNGNLFVTDNQGGWNPSNSLVHAVPGRFYGHYNPTDVFPPPPFTPLAGRFENQPVSPKTVHFPHNEVANSPTDILPITSGDFAGQLLVGELTTGGIRRVFLEEINGELQGAVFRFAQGFEGGVHRMRQAADGTIYVGCMGSSGSWSYQNLTQGLQRMRPKSEAPAVFEMKAVRATTTGLEIEFTLPVPLALLQNPPSFEVQQWRYVPTSNYGGPKIDRETLTVTSTSPSANRKRVSLNLPGIRSDRVIHVRTGVRNETGDELWSGEAWYSMIQFPGTDPDPEPDPDPDPDPNPVPTPQGTVRIELEDGALSGNAAPSNDEPDFSGTGFVAQWDNIGNNETITVTYQAPHDGDYQFLIRYGRGQWSGIGELPPAGYVNLILDNSPLTSVTLARATDWSEWLLTTPLTVPLTTGSHTITLRNPYSSAIEKPLGVANFDYLEITPPPIPPAPEPPPQ
ncbi:MAG: PA14 domain-containing protein, partial [Verrucomicrobiota bacterium]